MSFESTLISKLICSYWNDYIEKQLEAVTQSHNEFTWSKNSKLCGWYWSFCGVCFQLLGFPEVWEDRRKVLVLTQQSPEDVSSNTYKLKACRAPWWSGETGSLVKWHLWVVGKLPWRWHAGTWLALSSQNLQLSAAWLVYLWFFTA